MTKKNTNRREQIKSGPPAAGPKRPDPFPELTAAFQFLLIPLNGAINQATNSVEGHMDEGFKRIEEILANRRP